jgi:DMSO/TMAO reductase YedYZ molybdopterin-dependent catalytic subunit
MGPSRRRFLAALGAAGVAAWNLDRLDALLNANADVAQAAPPVPGARFVGNVPLGRFDGKPTPPLDKLLGSGLDARQFVDLSTLTPETLVTSNDRFFVRTAASGPNANIDASRWSIHIGGRVQRPLDISFDALRAESRDMGAHLIECSGNADPANFGLISAARWSGVPLITVLDRSGIQSQRVCVIGVDDEETPSRSSVPGGSWIFSRDDLASTGAFLATNMNGADLPRDHGFPVRLVVPGWYGCSCIKWVTRIEIVGDDEPSTAQMKEFAARTHQDGVPQLARDFQPPVIDLAAAPIRVEQWTTADGHKVYRVVGIRWGGTKPTCALTIRFKHNEPFVPVDRCTPPAATTTWSLWSHVWRPEAPGRYQIVLSAADPSVRARRLDMRYYTREVEIISE